MVTTLIILDSITFFKPIGYTDTSIKVISSLKTIALGFKAFAYISQVFDGLTYCILLSARAVRAPIHCPRMEGRSPDGGYSESKQQF